MKCAGTGIFSGIVHDNFSGQDDSIPLVRQTVSDEGCYAVDVIIRYNL